MGRRPRPKPKPKRPRKEINYQFLNCLEVNWNRDNIKNDFTILGQVLIILTVSGLAFLISYGFLYLTVEIANKFSETMQFGDALGTAFIIIFLPLTFIFIFIRWTKWSLI